MCGRYPHEREILFAPLTGIEVQNCRVEGSTIVVQVRLSINMMSQSIEQVMAKMRTANVQLLDIKLAVFRLSLRCRWSKGDFEVLDMSE